MWTNENDAPMPNNLKTFEFNGLSLKTTPTEVKEYFSRFGQQLMITINLTRKRKSMGTFSVSVASAYAVAMLSTIPVHIIGRSKCRQLNKRKCGLLVVVMMGLI